MKKILLTVVALAFAASSGVTFAAAHTGPKADDKVAAACKDKKPGDMVKVDGKDTKCPAKEEKKAK